MDSDTVTEYNSAVSTNERELTLEELADAVGLPVRTIRYYIAEGLLPGPEGRGKTAFYGEEQERRLRLIRLLAEQRLPLAEIRERLNGLSLDDVRSLLAEESSRAAEMSRAAEALSPRDYISAMLRKARTPPELAEGSASYAASPPLSAPSPLGRVVQQRSPTPPAPGTWQHFELAPGIELQVRADARTHFRDLIERLLRVAQESGSQKPEARSQNPEVRK